jgi:hypothetical protein
MALVHLPGVKEQVVVPGATHLFEEPGTLDQVIEHSRGWFQRHFRRVRAGESVK